MSRDGQEVWSRTDNILRTDRRLFQDVDVRDPQQKSDHYMVLGCLWGEAVKELTDYLSKAHRSPLRIIRHDLPCASENIFSDLRTHIHKPPLCERVRRAWIYDETWAAMDSGVSGPSGKSADGSAWASAWIGRDGWRIQATLLSPSSHRTPPL